MDLTDWVAIASTLGIAVLGWLKFRQSQRVDAISAQSGVAANGRAGVEQLIKGLNDLVDQLQEENEKLRADATSRATRLEAMTMEVARLRRRYGNGDNGP